MRHRFVKWKKRLGGYLRTQWPWLVVMYLVAVGIAIPAYYFLTSTTARQKQSIEFLSVAAQVTGWIIPVMLSALTITWSFGNRRLDTHMRRALMDITPLAITWGMIVALACLSVLAVNSVQQISPKILHDVIFFVSISASAIIILIFGFFFRMAQTSLQVKHKSNSRRGYFVRTVTTRNGAVKVVNSPLHDKTARAQIKRHLQ